MTGAVAARPRWPAAALLAAGAPIALGAAGVAGAVPAPCPLRAATGLPCPLCGASRAFTALADGDVDAALAYHLPLVGLAAAVLLVAAAGLLAPGRTEAGVRAAGAWGRRRATPLLLVAAAACWSWTLAHHGLVAP